MQTPGNVVKVYKKEVLENSQDGIKWDFYPAKYIWKKSWVE